MPPSNTGPVYFPITEEMVGPIRPVLLLLLGAVICLLLIACKNLTNLMLARSAARRVHLLHKWLTESILLTIGGGLTGILIAICGMDILKAWNPCYIPRVYIVSIDVWAMGFTLTLSLITGMGFGFLTSFRGPHAELRSNLTGHNRGTAVAAAFWLAGQASDNLKISMPSVSNDLTDLRKEAVFAPTQSEDDGVPMLIHIAQTHSNVQVRAQAIFWLGQHADHPEVIEVLKRLALE